MRSTNDDSGGLRIPNACPSAVDFLTTAVRGDGIPVVLSAGGLADRCWPAAGSPSDAPVLSRQSRRNLTTESMALAIRPGLGDVGEQSGPGEPGLLDGPGDLVVSRGSDTLSCWDATTGCPVGEPARDASLRGQSFGRFPMTALTAEGTPWVLTDAADGGLVRWRVAGGPRIDGVLATGVGPIWALATARLPDGTPMVLSGGQDGLLHRWDPVGGTELGSPIEDCGPVLAIALADLEDGRTVLCAGDVAGQLHSRDPATGEPLGPPVQLGWRPSKWQRVWPGRLAVVPTSRGPVAAVGIRDTVSLRDLVSGETVGELAFSGGRIAGIATAVLPDGVRVLVVGDSSGRVHRVDTRTWERLGDPVLPHGHLARHVLPVRLADGREVLTVAGARDVRSFDRGTGAPVAAAEDCWEAGSPHAVAVATAPDGTALLIAADEDGITHQDLATGTVQPRGEDDEQEWNTVWDVATAALPDGRVIAAGAGHDRHVHFWDALTGTALGEPRTGHPISVKAVAAARGADGSPIFVTGCEAGLVLRWDAATGTRIGEPLEGHGAAVESVVDLDVVDLPGGRQMLVGLDRHGLHRWDPATGEPLGPTIPLSGNAWLQAVWADAAGVPSAVVAGLEDAPQSEGVRHWRLDTGEPVDSGLSRAFRTAFTADGVTLAVFGASDGSLLVKPWAPAAGAPSPTNHEA